MFRGTPCTKEIVIKLSTIKLYRSENQFQNFFNNLIHFFATFIRKSLLKKNRNWKTINSQKEKHGYSINFA